MISMSIISCINYKFCRVRVAGTGDAARPRRHHGQDPDPGGSINSWWRVRVERSLFSLLLNPLRVPTGSTYRPLRYGRPQAARRALSSCAAAGAVGGVTLNAPPAMNASTCPPSRGRSG
jgi:hypothetical protein